MTDHDLPRLDVTATTNEGETAEIEAFASALVDAGKQPRFRVFYPKPEHFDGTDDDWEEWQQQTADTLELIDGVIECIDEGADS